MSNQQIDKAKCSALRVGGQAVMEGVMMKGKEKYSVSVRKNDGKIVTKIFKDDFTPALTGWIRIPVIRGVLRFIESLVVGMKTITYSSGFFLEDDAPKKERTGRVGKWIDQHQDGLLNTVSIVLGVGLALALFVFIPSLLSQLLASVIPGRLLLNLIEGVIRVVIFIGYIVIISQIKDIARVFEYHGAEHKTINALEDGTMLDPKLILRYSRLNRRCGTSFLFLVMLISILVFAFIRVDILWLKLLLRIVLIPVVAGLSYEVLMFSNKHHNPVVDVLIAPGLLLQKLTTREPDEAQIETAVASTLSILAEEGRLPEHLTEQWDEVKKSIELV